MLEIILLFALGKGIARKASAKGKAGWPWVLLLIGCWFAGEFAGAVVGTFALGGRPSSLLPLLSFLYFGAACGAVFAFVLLELVPGERPRARRVRQRAEDLDDTAEWAHRKYEEDRFDEQGIRIRPAGR